MLKRLALLVLTALAVLGCSDPAQSARSIVNDSKVLVPVSETRDGTVGSGGSVFYRDYLLKEPVSSGAAILEPPGGYVSAPPYASPGTDWEYIEQWVDAAAKHGPCTILVKRLVDPDKSLEPPQEELLGQGEIVRVEASCG